MRTIRRHMRRSQLFVPTPPVFSQNLATLAWVDKDSANITSVTDVIDFQSAQFPQIDIDMLHLDDQLIENNLHDDQSFEYNIELNSVDEPGVNCALSVTDKDPLAVTISVASSEDENSSILQSADPVVSTQFEGHVDDDIPDLDSLSIVSLPDNSTASSTDDKEHECLKRLYLWSTRFSISRVAKSDLLALLRDVAFPNLPMDWRTLEKRQKAELSLMNEYSQKSVMHDYVVTVCGNCFLFRFDQEALKLVTPCSHCNAHIHVSLLNLWANDR